MVVQPLAVTLRPPARRHFRTNSAHKPFPSFQWAFA